MPLFVPSRPLRRLASQQFYNSRGGSIGTLLLVQATMYLTPFELDYTTTFDRIGCYVSVVGTQGGGGAPVVRLGVYQDVNGLPSGAPLLDAGTIDGTILNDQDITISFTLPPGIYWKAVVGQGAPTTQTTLRAAASSSDERVGAVSHSSANWAGLNQTGVTGALPACTATAGATVLPLVSLRPL